VGAGLITARIGAVDDPDVTLDGPPRVVRGLLMGNLDLTSA
jgi:hypothetical protein